MLARRVRRWPNIKTTLRQVSCLLVTAPGINSRPNTATLSKCWASVVDGVPAMKQRWLNVIVQRFATHCNNTQLTLQQHSADTRRR